MRARAPPLADGGRFHPGFMLCDPTATRAVHVLLPESAYTNAPKMPPALDLDQPVLLASLAAYTEVRGAGGEPHGVP